MLWVGVGVGIFYWLAESMLHVLIFLEGDFFSQFFPQNPHELWKRLLVVALIISFGFYAQLTVSERKKSEKLLKESERKYRTLFEDALNPIFLFNDKGHYLDCNLAAADFFEFDREDTIDKILQTFSISDYSILPDIEIDYFSAQRNIEANYFIHGSHKTLLLNLVPISSVPEMIIYGIGQDITERKKMEDEITLAHAELDQIFQTATVAMRLVDLKFNVIKANETFEKLAGIKMDEGIECKCYEDFAGPLCNTSSCPLKRIIAGESEIVYEVNKRRRDGAEILCILTARPFLGPDGKVKGIIESFKDVTEITRVQEELLFEQAKLHQILFHRYEGVGILKTDFTIEYQNETLTSQIGDNKGKHCYEAIMERQTPCEKCLLHSAIATEKPKRFEVDTSSGTSYELTYTPFVESDGEEKVVMTLRDITQRKAARAAAIQSEQLVAIGSLAAGVAHEINNPINGIINYGQILIKKSGQEQVVKSVARRVVREGDRIARIVENLLSFTRREKKSRTAIGIDRVIEDTLSLTAAQMRKDAIDVRVSIPSDLPSVVVVAQEIQQVFLNFFNNAQYALNQKYPDTHTSKVIEISAGMTSDTDNRWLKVSFYDSGIGIPSAIIDKVMNPFFSTKPSGKGTGLGLSISHNIVNKHGGKLSIKSVEGKYTRLDLELPVAMESRRQGGKDEGKNTGGR
jgi:PAS domain S-box-containing protein